MTVRFHKMTGSGNDFVMLDGRSNRPEDWSVDAIAAICDRRNGIGADGLVFVTPDGDDAVRMTYFNSDGSPAPMCGNAALCSTRLAVTLEMAAPSEMTLVTEAATFRTRCVGPGTMAELNLPDFSIPHLIHPAVAGNEPSRSPEHWVRLGVVGVPHAVVLVDSLAQVDLDQRGRQLRFDPACGTGGANVNFVGRVPPVDGGPGWQIRTYERGIEAETLACGTGTVAAAVALASTGLADLPLQVLTASGKVLSVSAELSGGVATNVWLCGEGREVARGEWLG